MENESSQTRHDRPEPDPDHTDEHGHGHKHGPCCGSEHDHHEPDHAHDEEEANSRAAAATLAALDRQFFFYVGTVLLLLWGVVMIYFFGTGRIVNYLIGNGTFRIQCLVAGLILCVLAVFNFLTAHRGAGVAHHHEPEHDHEHDHGEGDDCGDRGHDHHHDEGNWLGRVVSFVILTVPLTAAAIYTPDAYSTEFSQSKAAATATGTISAMRGGALDLKERAVAKAGASAAAPAADTKKPETPGANPGDFTVDELERLSGGRSPEGNIRLQLVEIFYMPAQTHDVKTVVASQPLETIGQAIKDTAVPGRLRLFRLMMTCCAADARPVSIPVEFDGAAPEWREMGWYKVTGKIEYRDENGQPTAVFKAKTFASEKPPRNQMMF